MSLADARATFETFGHLTDTDVFCATSDNDLTGLMHSAIMVAHRLGETRVMARVLRLLIMEGTRRGANVSESFTRSLWACINALVEISGSGVHTGASDAMPIRALLDSVPETLILERGHALFLADRISDAFLLLAKAIRSGKISDIIVVSECNFVNLYYQTSVHNSQYVDIERIFNLSSKNDNVTPHIAAMRALTALRRAILACAKAESFDTVAYSALRAAARGAEAHFAAKSAVMLEARLALCRHSQMPVRALFREMHVVIDIAARDDALGTRHASFLRMLLSLVAYGVANVVRLPKNAVHACAKRLLDSISNFDLYDAPNYINSCAHNYMAVFLCCSGQYGASLPYQQYLYDTNKRRAVADKYPITALSMAIYRRLEVSTDPYGPDDEVARAESAEFYGHAARYLMWRWRGTPDNVCYTGILWFYVAATFALERDSPECSATTQAARTLGQLLLVPLVFGIGKGAFIAFMTDLYRAVAASAEMLPFAPEFAQRAARAFQGAHLRLVETGFKFVHHGNKAVVEESAPGELLSDLAPRSALLFRAVCIFHAMTNLTLLNEHAPNSRQRCEVVLAATLAMAARAARERDEPYTDAMVARIGATMRASL